MSAPKHTPGPWLRATPYATHIVIKGGRMVADAPHSHWITTEEGFANANLIAAAPEMLEALENFVNTVPAQGDETLIRAKEMANAAIRKAKGEA